MGESVRLEAADGHRLDAYLARPSGPAKAGLVVVQEVFGVNRHIRSVTDGYARDGYLAIAPALFDRVEPGVELGYVEPDLGRGRQIRGQIGWDQALADVAAAAETVREAGKVGIVGYCWGGSVAWAAACRGRLDAAVCYYGGNVHELKAEQPRCPVLLHFGDRDKFITPEHVEAIATAHPEAEIHRYDAGHGFNCEDRGDFDPASAELGRSRSLAFLGRSLA